MSSVFRPSCFPEWLPAALAGLAFVGFAVVFVWEVFAYQKAVVGWARRDLQSRADLAAANLEEPLRTQDFRKIHEFGADSVADGVRLVINGVNGGRIFDTARDPNEEVPSYSCTSRSGEYKVTVSVPSGRVLAPFTRALVGFGLAGLVGVAGVLLFFFVTYRQRVRIRELARLEKFRRDFVADVSHEIKTPLTGILGAADMLGDGNLPPAMTAKLVGLVKDSSQRLNALVQGILSLARLEREGDILSFAETDVDELLRETVETLRPQAEAKGVTLVAGRQDEGVLPTQGGDGVVGRTPRPALTARLDAQLVGQALANLIVNAIRHSGSKDVVVSAEKAGRKLQLVVEDHGVGIPSEHHARIFERFYRVDAARAAETGGSGLGLAIVRQIARLHGGDVRLETASPSGCRFVLELDPRKP